MLSPECRACLKVWPLPPLQFAGLDSLPPTTSYVGYDLNRAYIEAARNRYGDRGRFFCARVGEEPSEVEEGTFDVVVAVALLHHLHDDDALRVVQSARRALAPGGSFVTLDATLHAGQGFVSRTLARLYRGITSRPRAAAPWAALPRRVTKGLRRSTRGGGGLSRGGRSKRRASMRRFRRRRR